MSKLETAVLRQGIIVKCYRRCVVMVKIALEILERRLGSPTTSNHLLRIAYIQPLKNITKICRELF